MLTEIVFYLIAILGLIVGLLVVERIVAGPHVKAGTGYARVDSAFDFDRLRAHQNAARVRSLLLHHGHPTDSRLPEFTHDYRQLREAGEQLIPLAGIVGSVDGGSRVFDRKFRPVSERARARLAGVLAAMREGLPLPPIDVWAWHGEYYVLDGHHRVAAARALGLDHISAHVTEVS